MPDTDIFERNKSNATNPVKKIYRISNKSIVVIDDTLAKRFAIYNEDSWVEQKQIEHGILLIVRRPQGKVYRVD